MVYCYFVISGLLCPLLNMAPTTVDRLTKFMFSLSGATKFCSDRRKIIRHSLFPLSHYQPTVLLTADVAIDKPYLQ